MQGSWGRLSAGSLHCLVATLLKDGLDGRPTKTSFYLATLGIHPQTSLINVAKWERSDTLSWFLERLYKGGTHVTVFLSLNDEEMRPRDKIHRKSDCSTGLFPGQAAPKELLHVCRVPRTLLSERGCHYLRAKCQASSPGLEEVQGGYLVTRIRGLVGWGGLSDVPDGWCQLPVTPGQAHLLYRNRPVKENNYSNCLVHNKVRIPSCGLALSKEFFVFQLLLSNYTYSSRLKKEKNRRHKKINITSNIKDHIFNIYNFFLRNSYI